MGIISFCLITFALVLNIGPSVEAKGKKCKKPMGIPGDLAKCSGKGKWVREYPLKEIQETVEENGEKLDELIKGEYGENNNCPMWLFGDTYDGSSTAYNPYHVVTNEEDWWSPQYTNFWMTNARKTGDEARLYMVFQCSRTIKGFLLKNTHNGERLSRGTKDFTISISDSIDGPWTDILTGSLPDPLDVSGVPVSPVPVLNFELENKVEAKVVRFQIDSFFHRGGGLQYFSTY